MIHIDGALGEGGGQVLRTALGLSVATGQPFSIDGIRRNRQKPGLQRQHLTAVLAAQQVGDADVDGAATGSTSLTFRPRGLRAGAFRFAIGTAGSTTLVLQAVLPALWSAKAVSTVELVGGTHNPLAPPFDFLARSFAPVVARLGGGLELALHRHGFHPAGGGVLTATVSPATWRPLAIERDALPPRLSARIVLCGIPRHVAEREAAVLQQRLELPAAATTIDTVESNGPGNVVLVMIEGAGGTEVITSLGERAVSAERVAERAAQAVRQFVRSGAPVGEHLADQLLIPMALAGGGTFVTTEPSQHTRTNAMVVQRFLPVCIEMAADGDAFRVSVQPR